MTSSDPSPGDRPPVAGATSDSNALPRPATPWDETVKMTPRPSAPRTGSEPAVPEEAAAAPPDARFGKFMARVTEGASNYSVSGLVVGTPAYMPPEQAAGERADARADVTALGATLYELITDLKPFDGPNVYETLKRVQESDPVAPRRIDPKIPVDLETIVLKCLAKEAAGRYASAQALSDDLAAFLAGESIRARPESLSRKIARKVRRHPVAVGAVALLLAALAVAIPLASGGARDRRIAELAQSIQLALGRGEWTAASLERLEGEAAALERLAPFQARQARDGVRSALVEAARAEIRGGDLPRARALLDLLEPRDATLARILREDLKSNGRSRSPPRPSWRGGTRRSG